MDEEIKSSAELEQALADQVTGEIPDMTEPTHHLRTAATALGELVDIRDTIQAEGVSQEDVRSVFDIIKRLDDSGVECGVCPSLEEHGLGHYTSNRTIVNQQVSLEGIGETIVKVIKIVIEKLISFVANLVRKYKVYAASDKKISRNFDNAREMAKDIQETIVILRRYSLTSTVDVDNKAQDYATQLLKTDGILPRTPITLAALLDEKPLAEIKQLVAGAEEATRYLRLSVKSMRGFLNGGGEAIIDESALQHLSILRQEAERMLVEDPYSKMLTQHINGKMLLDNSLRKRAEHIAKHEYLLKAFYSIADELRGIKAVNLKADYTEQDARDISDTINELTQGFEDLDVLIQFMVHVKNTQLKVFKLQLQVLNRYVSLLLLHIRENTVHETSRKAAEDAFTKLEKKLKTYGV